MIPPETQYDEKNIKIIGAGLIGTSLALAAGERGYRIEIIDSDPKKQDLARDLLAPFLKAERDLKDERDPWIIVVATPPSVVPPIVLRELELHPHSIVIDVASVKTNVLHEVQKLSVDLSRYVGTHPMAGREIGGAPAAQNDLFRGRAWIITNTGAIGEEQAGRGSVLRVQEFIESLGADIFFMSSYEHDRLMAQISHVPQILSTLLAGHLSGSKAEIELAGQGFRDMTRLAASDPLLWSEILVNNREEIIRDLLLIGEAIEEIGAAITSANGEKIAEIFKRGGEIRAKLSGKHGAVARNYQTLHIVIDDRPGQLAELFTIAASIHANIEDLSIEHSPSQPTGLISLSFSPNDGDRMLSELLDKKWKVHTQ
jgi:prephenate dehydrogenase